MCIWKKKNLSLPRIKLDKLMNLVMECNTCSSRTQSIPEPTFQLSSYFSLVKQEWKKDHSNLIDSISSFNPNYYLL